jgi:hypothetical protein
MPILTPTDKLNLEVASWITSHRAMTSISHLLLEDNVGEDGLSSHLTYKDNIEDFDAPGMIVTRLLDHCQPSISKLNNVYGAIMKVLNEMRVQMTLKKTLHVLACQGRNINTNVAEIQAKDVVFPTIDDLELVDWTSLNQYARFWYCEDIHHSSILRQAIVKAINKSPDHLLSSNLFKDDSNDQQNQFVGFVSSHIKSNHVTLFHIHSFAVFHTDLQSNTIVA